MDRHFPVLHIPDRAIPCEVVRHFPVLYIQVVHFQSPQDDDGENEDDDGDDDIAMTIVISASPAVSPCRTNKTCREIRGVHT